MDRFIADFQFSIRQTIQHLKSNMDRFIGINAVFSLRFRRFKIQYG